MDASLFRAALALGEPLVLDGGLATQLEAQGCDLSDSLWSARLLIEDPEAITSAHLAFFLAGARVATTASYQATFEGFARRGIDRPGAEALLRRSVDLAVEARRRHVVERELADQQSSTAAPLFIAASIGPYGAMLADGSEYRGRYGRTVAALRDFHRDRLRVLADTPADVLAIETIPEVEEVEALASLVGDLAAERPGVAAWISVSCADGARLRSGAPVEAAAQAIGDSPGIVALGINCTPPEFAEELVARLRTVTSRPIVVYPNSGEGWDPVARSWSGAAAGRVDAAAAARWSAAGATLIGGCCRVTPDHVAGLAAGLVPASTGGRQ